jgi:hypothetical protein
MSNDQAKRKRISVLPVMTCPNTKNSYFLLGRNRVVQDWAEGSAFWSDFGGRLQHVSESIEACATREFIEESLECIVKLYDAELFQQSLRDQEYILKYEDDHHIIFVVRFDWNPACCYDFESFRKILSAIRKISVGYTLGNKDESIRLRKLGWFQSKTKKKKLLDILQHPAIRTRTECIEREPLQRAITSLASALHYKNEVIINQNQHKKINNASYCIIIESVNNDWLEKDQIALFSMEQVRHMLTVKEICSTYFYPLKTILQNMCFSNETSCDVLTVDKVK